MLSLGKDSVQRCSRLRCQGYIKANGSRAKNGRQFAEWVREKWKQSRAVRHPEERPGPCARVGINPRGSVVKPAKDGKYNLITNITGCTEKSGRCKAMAGKGANSQRFRVQTRRSRKTGEAVTP